jgi:hypothetical protein
MTSLGQKMCNNSCCTTSVLASTHVSWEAGSKGGEGGRDRICRAYATYPPSSLSRSCSHFPPGMQQLLLLLVAAPALSRPQQGRAGTGLPRLIIFGHRVKTKAGKDRWLTCHDFRRGRNVKIGVPLSHYFRT